MFKGTDELESGEFSRTVAGLGGNENAFTGADYTGYFQTIARDRLELVMEMEADRMTNLVLDPEEVRLERNVVLEERSLRVTSIHPGRTATAMQQSVRDQEGAGYDPDRGHPSRVGVRPGTLKRAGQGMVGMAFQGCRRSQEDIAIHVGRSEPYHLRYDRVVDGQRARLVEDDRI